MIYAIYAQEDLSVIKEHDIVFFLAGPTRPNYKWRQQLVSLIEKINIKFDYDIYFLIPESRVHIGCSTGIGNKIISYESSNKEFYHKMFTEHKMSFDGVNQIQWETHGLEKNYVIYNMCQHWQIDTINGYHGNISPTGRMEVCPQLSDPQKWIYYNNFSKNIDLNSSTEVALGGEAEGENIGWLVWWIVKRNLSYALSIEHLIDHIIAKIK
jgi:hypothetical protein